MSKLHIITPVKDSLKTTLLTISSIKQSETSIPSEYFVYNDFSTDDNSKILSEEAEKQNFEIIHLKDITTHPSPNYLLVLQMAQKKALSQNAHLLVIESDVVIKENTISQLLDNANLLHKPGMIAAVTTDEKAKINFPYLFAQKYKTGVINTRKRLSFCCTLITNEFLKAYNFEELNPEKSWYDVFISHKSIALGFNNYLMTNLQVLHLPHSSRPWKLLKYSNPLKYYWRKFIDKRDKI